MFITFEGIDGSGKSTQVERMAVWLRDQGHSVEVMRDPGGTNVSEQIRTLLLMPEAEIGPRAELFLFAAARAQLVEERVRPALERGAIVLCDRFYDSTTAYQGGGRGVATPQWMNALHKESTGGLVPDRTYIIDVPVAVAESRRSASRNDRMEAEAIHFRKRVRSAYQEIATQEPGRVCLIDGNQSLDRVEAQVQADLTRIWPGVATGTPQ